MFRTLSATLLLTIALALAPADSGAVPAEPFESLVEVGSGELTWFGLRVYDARLLSGRPEFRGLDSAEPMALEITYRRNISSERLVESTAKEWRRLEGALGLPGEARRQQWLDAVAEIWPDVTPGDRIIARYEPGGPTLFYGNDGLLGVVDDPEFGPAFLGIWLHPDTRDTGLRTALLGAQR